ncbi:MAG: HAD family phosphatase [Bacteroidales bacterium]|nr:HAD family phosphatase [Bacteroidales bacterium]
MEYGFIFDMDGVVIDSNPYHKIAWEKFLSGQGIPYDDQLFDNVLSGRTGPTSLRMLFGKDLSQEKLDLFLEEVDSNYQNILHRTEDVKPIAGLNSFLDQITRNGYRIALATSAPVLNIKLGLQKLKLENIFEHIVGKVDVTHGKPHPEVYLKTLELLDIPAENCLVFEDSRAGIQSALHAGIRVVGIASGHTKKDLLEEGVSLALDDFRGLELETVLALFQ